MSTIDQIEAFATFAKNQLGNGQECSIDDLYHQWRQQAFQDTDTLAVQASIQDLQNGERGQSLDELLAEFDAERRANTGE